MSKTCLRTCFQRLDSGSSYFQNIDDQFCVQLDLGLALAQGHARYHAWTQKLRQHGVVHVTDTKHAGIAADEAQNIVAGRAKTPRFKFN